MNNLAWHIEQSVYDVAPVLNRSNCRETIIITAENVSNTLVPIREIIDHEITGVDILWIRLRCVEFL